jgi:uncharacterized GH25 family protein
LAAALSVVVPAVFAHDIWLTTDKHGDAYIAAVAYGDTDAREMPDLRKIVTLELVSAGKRVNLRRPLEAQQRLGKPVFETKAFAAPAGSLLAVTYDNGFWVANPDDKIESNSTKLLVPNGTGSWWVPKFGKDLLGPGAYQQVIHTLLEVIPLEDPFQVPMGGKLPVRIEHEGKPLAGVEVDYGDGVTPIPDAQMPKVKTGSDGMAEIPLTRKGPYLLTVEYEGPGTRPDLADKDDMYASLTFDLSN